MGLDNVSRSTKHFKRVYIPRYIKWFLANGVFRFRALLIPSVGLAIFSTFESSNSHHEHEEEARKESHKVLTLTPAFDTSEKAPRIHPSSIMIRYMSSDIVIQINSRRFVVIPPRIISVGYVKWKNSTQQSSFLLDVRVA